MIDRRTVLTGLGAGLAAWPARAAARWQAIAAVPWPVQEVYGTAWRGKAVIAGGMAPSGAVNPQDRVGIYDPRADAWTEGPKLPSPRHHPVLATARDRVYAFGGLTVTKDGIWVAVKDALIMGEDAWTSVAAMPQFQCETVAVTLGDRIHIASGHAPKGEQNRNWNDHGDIDAHQVFDVRAGKWSTARPVPLARNSATGAVIDGLFYLAGGRRVGEGNSAQLDRYDPRTDRWETLRPMPRAAGGLGGAAAGGRLYVFGGEGGPGMIPESWSYDPKSDTWRAEPAMKTPRHGLAGIGIGGRVYALGGGVEVSGGKVSAIAEVLVPS